MANWGRIATGVGTFGTSEAYRKLKGKQSDRDVLFGKQMEEDPLDPEVRKFYQDGRDMQVRGMHGLEAMYNKDPTESVRNQATLEQNQAMGGIEDQKRRIRELVAQRGMDRSSIGFAQEQSAQRMGNQQIANIKLSIPERIRQLKISNQQGIMNAGGGLNAYNTSPIKTQTVGGLLPMAGAAAGAIIGKGKPGSAQAGMGVGQGIQGMYNQGR